MIENKDHLSLLSRNWKLPTCLAAITYLVVQLSMIYNHLVAAHPACTSPEFSSWTWHVNFIEAISFCVVIAIQIGHLALKIIPINELGSYATTLFVIVIAGISSLIKLCTDWTGNCEDIFGVRFAGVIWAEWIACVPFLYFIVLATDTKSRVSQTDFIIIILIEIAFILGMCLYLTHTFGLSLFLLVTTISLYSIGSILFYLVTISNRDHFTKAQCESTEGNAYRKHFKKSQVQLAICLLLILPLYPFIYFLSLFRVINHDFTFTYITTLNVASKLIFCTLMTSAHHSVMNEVIRLRLVSEIAANESRRLFVRYIMHEVRVPLSSITMGLGYLQQRSDDDDEAKEALLMMEGATGFMKQTLNDVLNMQRIEEGKLELDYSAFSIERTIYRVQASLHGAIKEKQVRLIIKIHPGVPELVIGDGFRVEHVIVNLVSNALKFSEPQSEIVVDIRVALMDTHQIAKTNNNKDNNCGKVNNNKRKDSNNGKFNRDLPSNRTSNSNSSRRFRLPSASNIFSRGSISPQIEAVPITTIIFSVTDTGRGISESDQKTLFLPFSQIRPHELQSGGGSGIGLVICKQIVELHGGTISCQSTLGVGTTFTFSIPFEVLVEGGGGGEVARGGVTDLVPVDDHCSSSRPASKVDATNSPKHTCTSPSNSHQHILPYKTKRMGRGSTASSNSSSNYHNVFPILHQHSGETMRSSDDEQDDEDVLVLVANRRQLENKHNNKFDSKDNEDDDNDLLIDFDANEELRSIRAAPISLSLLSTTHQSKDPNSADSSNCNSNNNSSSNNSSNCNNISYNANKSSSSISDHRKNSKGFYEEEKLQILNSDTYTIDNNNNSRTKSSDIFLSPFHEESSSPVLAVSTSASASASVDLKESAVVKHVLLVDDVSSNRRILSMLLRRRGIVSTMAVNGLEGVKAVMEGNQTFDMIFMDNSMPVMNGVEATQRLRAFGYPNLIIGITGNAMEEEVSEYIQAGADAVILKPVTVLQINQIFEYTESYGNTHVSGYKIIFTDMNYFLTKI